MCVHLLSVTPYSLNGFVENVIVIRIIAKVGNRAWCDGRVVYIARKILHSHVYFVHVDIYKIHGKW